jgi:hypothetical protein
MKAPRFKKISQAYEIRTEITAGPSAPDFDREAATLQSSLSHRIAMGDPPRETSSDGPSPRRRRPSRRSIVAQDMIPQSFSDLDRAGQAPTPRSIGTASTRPPEAPCTPGGGTGPAIPGEVTEQSADRNDMRRTRYPGWEGLPSFRLRKARIASGYRSGREAAQAHKWSIGTYFADESGRRQITPARAALYAAAFGVPAAWLLSAELSPELPAKEVERALKLDSLPMSQVAATVVGLSADVPAAPGASRRLEQARRDAGFASARGAARHFGWVTSTYHGHENGQINLNSRTVQVYGLAFGADPAWLLTGHLPEAETGAGTGKATGGRPADPAEVRSLSESLGAAKANSGSVQANSRVESPGSCDEASLRALIGPLSPGSPVGALVLLPVSPTSRGARGKASVRVIVDTGCRTVDRPATFAEADADGAVRLVRVGGRKRARSNVLGRVLLVLSAPD